jgi:N-acetyl-anhydromuramyl-L-alanine amidase AmpD
MRQVKEAIIHCAYTKPSMDIGFDEIDAWHKRRGFRSPSGIHCGYHVIIRRNGLIEHGRPYSETGAHCRGRNRHSIGICLVGGMNEQGKPDCNFTMSQYETLSILGSDLPFEFPEITFSGHRNHSKKTCPCFDVAALLGD